MTNFGIRVRLLLLTLVPLLVFSLIVGQYMVMTRIQDNEQALQERGKALARSLALESEFSLFSGNREYLMRLASGVLHEPNVHEVVIRDADREIIAHAHHPGNVLQQVDGIDEHAGLLMTFSAAAKRTSISISDHDELFVDLASGRQAGTETPIGWVEISMSREGALAQRQAIIRNIVMITSGTALLSILIALWMGRGIANPIIRLSRAVDDMRHQRLDTRVPPSSGAEIGALEQGFNEMAEAMEQSRNRLEHEVRDATGKLRSSIEALEQKNRELDTAREKALAAGDEKAKFLANMSHEIRTPINAILGYTSLLEKSGLSLEQYEFARTINCASNQLLQVIDDILSFSRLESGTVELDRSDFDLRDVLEDVLCMMGPEARGKQIELVLLIDSDVPMKLVGDVSRFRQVVINLISNAIKFTDQGGVNVQVRLLEIGDDEVEIELQVIDTGIGISREVLDDIFDSFHQADATISRRYGGTGLGLAIVSRLVKLWNGRIGVTSEPDVGSTFWFSYKCGLQASQDDLEISMQLEGCKILLYDDNPVARRAVRNLLMTWSTSVYLARQREQLGQMLDKAREANEPFDIVVLGFGLEQQDAEAVALVDRIRHEHQLPLLLMLNCRSSALLTRSLGDHRFKIAIKPVRRDILHRNICTLLGIDLDDSQRDVGETKQQDMEVSSQAVPDFSGLHVLLAEDNEFNRTLVTRILETAGIEVSEVASGAEALTLARQQEFDLVILDMHLPGLDGAETARRLRRLRPELAHVPIIALTADVFFNEPSKLRAAEIDACLLKPLDEGRMWTMIRTLCMSTESEGQAMPAIHAPEKEDISSMMRPQLIRAIEDQRRRIADAVDEGDLQTLIELVHEMKGVVGYFGLSELNDTVEAFDKALADRNRDPAALVYAMAQLDQTVDQMIS